METPKEEIRPNALTFENIEKARAVSERKSRELLFLSSLAPLALVFAQFSISYVGINLNPFLLPLALVAIFSLFAGRAAAAISCTVSVLFTFYFLIPPQNSFIKPLPTVIQPILFILSSFVINFAIEKKSYQHEIPKYKKEQEKLLTLLRLQKEESEKAKEAVRARDELLSVASHELKNPLTSVIFQLQTVLHSIRTVSLADFSVKNLLRNIEAAEQQTATLAKLINDLLNVSLITIGQFRLEPEKVDLVKLTRAKIANFSQEITGKNYQVKFKTTGSIVGNWDKVRLEQVVTNLLSNALKYGEGKPIEITVSKNNNDAKLIIKDQGVGIPNSDQQQIFAKFGRASSNHKGLGIGLYITNQIIKAHNGSIKVESKSNKGSTFSVQLPLQNEKKPN